MYYADEKQLIDMWRFEEQFPFGGWELMHLDGRWESEPLPWDYREEVLMRLKDTDMLLDIRMSLPAPPNRTSGIMKAAWSSLPPLAYGQCSATWMKKNCRLKTICSTWC